MEDRLKALYQSVILVHAKQPFRYEKKEDAQHTVHANNPICGDRFKLYLELEGDTIADLHFYGHGCAISKASSSILVKKLRGKTLAEARQWCLRMQEVVSPENTETDPDEEMAAFAAARHFPGRSQCATLSWDKLFAFLEERKG